MRLTLLVIACFFLLQANAQPVKIGQRFPTIKVLRIFNSSKAVKELIYPDGKIVLLDFWATTCGSCIKSMPKLAALQAEFKDNLSVVLVTDESLSKVKSFFSKRKALLDLGLPVIYQDSDLQKLFPHYGNPHVIWIGRNRKVEAITTGEFANYKNVKQLIETNQINLPENKVIPDFDINRPLLTFEKDTSVSLLYNSLFTGFINGLPTGTSTIRNLPGNRTKLLVCNMPLLDLYLTAYRHNINLENRNDLAHRLVVDIGDSALIKISGPEERVQKSYCYELVTKRLNDWNQNNFNVFRLMRKDLDRFFRLQSAIKTLNVTCYVLRFDSTFHQEGKGEIIEGNYETIYTNKPVTMIAYAFKESYIFDKPVIWELNDKMTCTVTLRNKFATFAEVKLALIQSGFTISEEEKSIEILEISRK